jgi:hypothetical protein
VKALAAEIRASAKQLRAAVDALAEPNERVDLLQRVRRASIPFFWVVEGWEGTGLGIS